MLMSSDSEISSLSQNNDSTALIGEEMVQSLQAELDDEETINDTLIDTNEFLSDFDSQNQSFAEVTESTQGQEFTDSLTGELSLTQVAAINPQAIGQGNAAGDMESSRPPFAIFLALIVLIALVGAGIWWVLNDGEKSQPAPVIAQRLSEGKPGAELELSSDGESAVVSLRLTVPAEKALRSSIQLKSPNHKDLDYLWNGSGEILIQVKKAAPRLRQVSLKMRRSVCLKL